jgi:hypothetical protein
LTIVGVAPNVRQWSTDDHDFDPVVYVPHAEMPVPFSTVLVRSNAGTAAMATAIRNTVNALDPDLALVELSSLDGLLDADRWESRMLSVVFGLGRRIGGHAGHRRRLRGHGLRVSRRTREIGRPDGARRTRPATYYFLVTRGAGLQVAVGIAPGRARRVRGARRARFDSQRNQATDGLTLAIVSPRCWPQ